MEEKKLLTETEIFEQPQLEKPVPESQTKVAEIIADIKKEQAGEILPEMKLEETSAKTASDFVSERECTAFIHSLYSFIAYIYKTEELPISTVQWRGQQFYLITIRYGLQFKYIDIMFFGLGVAGDIGLMLKNRKKSNIPEKEIIKVKEETEIKERTIS